MFAYRVSHIERPIVLYRKALAGILISDSERRELCDRSGPFGKHFARSRNIFADLDAEDTDCARL